MQCAKLESVILSTRVLLWGTLGSTLHPPWVRNRHTESTQEGPKGEPALDLTHAHADSAGRFTRGDDRRRTRAVDVNRFAFLASAPRDSAQPLLTHLMFHGRLSVDALAAAGVVGALCRCARSPLSPAALFLSAPPLAPLDSTRVSGHSRATSGPNSPNPRR